MENYPQIIIKYPPYVFYCRRTTNFKVVRSTVKTVNIRTPQKFAIIILKFEQDGFYQRVMHPKDATGIANSVDPDQTALGAV